MVRNSWATKATQKRKEVKTNKTDQSPDLPKATAVELVFESRVYRLDISVGSSKMGFNLPKKAVEALKEQIIELDFSGD